MIAISVKSDVRGAQRFVSRIGEQGVRRAAYRAINKGGQAAFTVGKRAVARDLRVPQKEIKDRFTLSKARPRNLTAWIRPNKAAWRPLGLIYYVTKSKRYVGAFRKQKGVRYKQPRGSGNRVMEDAFIAKGQHSGALQVFMRTGPERDAPIAKKSGPMPATSLRRDDVRRAMSTRARKIFGKEFNRQLKREIERAAR